jgi:hypothetical protein
MRVISAVLTVAFLGVAAAASAQTPGSLTSTVSETTTQGTVISSTRTTLVVKTDGDEYRLFELTDNTTRPQALPVTAAVEVTSQRGDIEGAATATRVRVTAPPTAAAGTQVPAAPATPGVGDPVPPDVRRLERSIERQTSRYRIGARAGMALDPELVTIGAQAQLGPFFENNLWARPNLEFGFGEVTTLMVINLDGIYRLPVTAPGARWASFFGAGIGFNFTNRGFEGEDDGERFDFDDFVFDTGLNLMAGVQARSGMFIELRAGVYSEPHLRLTFGYNFW